MRKKLRMAWSSVRAFNSACAKVRHFSTYSRRTAMAAELDEIYRAPRGLRLVRASSR
jgi:hypothetical protein